MEELVKTKSQSEIIKDYIELFKTAEEECTKAKSTKKTSSKKVGTKVKGYSVDLSSGLDCIITKHISDHVDDIQLILMPSQNKYVLKQNKVINMITKDSFMAFFKDLDCSTIQIKNTIIDELNKNNIVSLYELIKKYPDLLSKGLVSLPIYCNNSRTMNFMCDSDEALTKLIATKTPILNYSNPLVQKKYNANFLWTANAFFELRGYDAARMFVIEYTKSSLTCVNGYPYLHDTFRLILDKKYDLDTKRLIEYVCYDAYKQGYTSFPATDYEGYLRMQRDYYGKVKDKYPAFLDIAHDTMSIKYNENRVKIERECFIREYDTFKNLYEGIESIVANGIHFVYPESPKDLIDEGVNLGHCVGSYAKRVANGECVILFARKDGHETESYLTVELAPFNDYGKQNYKILQIQADSKRTELTEDEKEFFKKINKVTGIELSNRNFV